ncbi:MAG: NUDIX hydrolase [Candidatus Paceibacterota bacterium]
MDIERPESPQPIPDDAELVFKGELFGVYQWKQEMFDGSLEIFEKVKRPDTVSVFPVLADGDVLLSEEQQPGKVSSIRSIGGRVDEEEEVLTAAKRELLEEAGLEAHEFVLWRAEQPVSKVDWAVFTFVAKGLEKRQEQDLDHGERVKLKKVSFDELLDLAFDERFSDRGVALELMQAKADPKKKEELSRLFVADDL